MLGFAFGLPFCVPNFKAIGVRVCVLYQFLQVCKKTKKNKKEKKRRKKRNFGRSYLENGFSDFLQIWNVDSPSWWETLQQIWFQSDKLSPGYKSVKMTFSSCKYTHSVAHRLLGPHDTLPCILILTGGTPAPWAARHTEWSLTHGKGYGFQNLEQISQDFTDFKRFHKIERELQNLISNYRLV